jgi:hypothetical protein
VVSTENSYIKHTLFKRQTSLGAESVPPISQGVLSFNIVIMKTNVVMIRKMGDYPVLQRTKDAMFNASDLSAKWSKNKSKRDIKRFLDSPKTKEFIDEMITQESPEAKVLFAENEIIDITKGRNTKNGKTPDVIWMTPFLFLKFAMWINPRYEFHVIKFVFDQLIEFRHSAGDMYKGLTRALSIFPDTNYSQVAKGLNHIIFNRHERGIRQTATVDELKRMTELEKKLAFSIDMGYIKSYKKLIIDMRNIYSAKYF